MFAIIGIVVVFGSIVGGYLMEHGNLMVLIQPAELLIIGGAAAGTVLIANPLHILKQIAGGVAGVFGSSKFTKQVYLDSLKTIYDLFNKARREGLVSLESDIEEPEKSPILSKNPAFIKNHHIMDFFCDTMRMAVSGMEPFDLDQVLDLDLEVHHQQVAIPISALSTTADSPDRGTAGPLSRSWKRPVAVAEANRLRPLPKLRPHRESVWRTAPAPSSLSRRKRVMVDTTAAPGRLPMQISSPP